MELLWKIDPIVIYIENIYSNMYSYLKYILGGLLVACFSAASFSLFNNNLSNIKNSYMQIDDPVENYEKAWKKVDSLSNKGLPKSALKVVESIYAKAKKENNTSQFIKAVIHKLKFQSYTEEDAFEKSLEQLKKETELAQFPAKQILHSMLGEMYWQYYANNRYLFLNRTKTQNFDLGQISTWDLNKIVEQTLYHHQASLTESEKSKLLNIEKIDPITYAGSNDKKFRPTLYDFLAHRAVDFFSGEEPSIIRPATQFVLNEDKYFLPAEEFIKLDINTGDSLAFKYYGIITLLDLIKFHRKDADPSAFVDAELKRLNFIRSNSSNPLKDTLYLRALEQLEKQVIDYPISAEVSYYIAHVYFERGEKYNPQQTEDYKWDLKKAYDICTKAKVRTKNGVDGEVGHSLCSSLQSQIMSKSIEVTLEEVNLPNQPFRSLITYKNIPNLFVKIFKHSREDLKKVQNDYANQKSNSYKDYNEILLDFYKKQSPVKEFSLKLPNDDDFQKHSLEAKMPELPLGEYIILVGTDEELSYLQNAIAYDFTKITNISYIHRIQKNGKMDLYLLHRDTGVPLAGATAQVFYEEYDQKKRDYVSRQGPTFTADNNGYIEIGTNEEKSFSLEFKYGADLFHISSKGRYQREAVFYQRNVNESANDYTTLQSYYFTDRAIYRPGQTIYFKGILLKKGENNKHEIVKKTEVMVTLYDVNYQSVANLKLVTNEFGTFSGTFTAPSSGLNGQMNIQDNVGGSHNISVEDYKRPKFEVELESIKGSFRLGDSVHVKGNAKAYAGSNIDQATVKYRVVRTAVFPIWWFYWKGYYPPSPAMEITNGFTKTDEKGEFRIDFSAIPDLSISKESKPTYNYTIYADVTDINGETRSAEKSVTIGYTALKIEVKVPPFLFKELEKKFSITSTNLSGEFEPAKGSITIHNLKAPERIFRERKWQRPDKFLMTKEEFYKDFPYDVYEDENNFYKWLKGKKILDLTFDTSKEKVLDLKDAKNWDQGKYVLEIISKDKYGEEVKEVVYFTVVEKENKKIPLPQLDWFSMIEASGEPGEKASFLAGSADEIKVLYEIEQEGKISQKKWLSLKNEQQIFEIPLEESYRGNIGLHYTFIRHNRLFRHSETIVVPFTNKELDISFETFRNKLLPGEKETWKVRIKGKQGEKVAAEMVATLYDASLDAFRANNFEFNIYNTYYVSQSWESYGGFNISQAMIYQKNWNDIIYGNSRSYRQLNWFGYGMYYYGGGNRNRVMNKKPIVSRRFSEPEGESKKEMSSDKALMEVQEESAAAPAMADSAPGKADGQKQAKKEDLSGIQSRKNFNETAFFYPHLQTDANGDVLISFTVPEALTRWKMLGFAHTQDLKYGFAQNQLVTQKELMVVPNVPRFFREGDQISFAVKINNLADKDLSGSSQLMLFDAITMKPIDDLLSLKDAVKSFDTKKGQSTSLSWNLSFPEGVEAITYRVVAKAGNFSDGEEMAIPVLTNRMLVTETLPLPVRSNQTKVFTLDKLINNQSATLKNHKLTLEYTSQPAWYAVQALPYLMEYPYECAEQVFSRFYANSIATHIANSSPKIKNVFDAWKNAPSTGTQGALISNLEKNQELKALMLEETPWVQDAQNETERKRRVAVLFDINRMSDELGRALDKLIKLQYSNGGWPWFQGMPENRYITQHIITGLGHLDHLSVKNIRENSKTWSMVQNGIQYLDGEMEKDYEGLKRLEKKKQIKMTDNHLHGLIIQYLYARSYFKDIAMDKKKQEALNYYISQAKKYWLQNDRYYQGMMALALHRYSDKVTPADIIKSLREHAIISEEMGMYWKEQWGYYWWQMPIETQALLIEVFDEVAKDQKSVDDMKVWLLKQKQTQDWRTTKATTEACYALLLKGTNWLASDVLVEISLGNERIDPKKREDVKVEAGTGYFKTSWSGGEIKKEMGKITVVKKDEGASWGALYWQYFEQLDKITPHETPLKLKKQLFLESNTASGPVITPVKLGTSLKVGDLLKVRIELRVDRNMEFVHMKDMRASGFEPINVLSSFKYQDGLGYYESTRDAATNFFFDYLPKGTYVFEYPLRVTHKGDFSNGVTTIQSMYAPEFASHSEGVRVKVE